jgi:MoaA/NifB/PqqE/SkfB family radical SAM enzyme
MCKKVTKSLHAKVVPLTIVNIDKIYKSTPIPSLSMEKEKSDSRSGNGRQNLAVPRPQPKMKKEIEGRGVALHVLGKEAGMKYDARGGGDVAATILKQIQGTYQNLGLDSRDRADEPLELDGTKLAFHTDRIEAWLRGERIAPILVDWALTRKCNYECGFCYAELQRNEEHELSPFAIDRTIDDMAEVGVRAASLVSDGESTIHPHFYDAIHRMKTSGMDTAFASNAYLLKEEKLEQLLRDITYIRVNFSAGEPKRYAEIMGGRASSPERMKLYETTFFPKVVDNIKKMVKIKEDNNLEATIGMQMVMMPQDADQAIPLAKLGVDLGVDYVVIKHCTDDEQRTLGIDYTKYEEVADKVLEAESYSNDRTFVKAKWSKILSGGQREYHQCFGPPFLLQFSGSGLVAPCGGLFNSRYANDFHVGNIAEKGFKEIWESDKYWEAMDRIRGKYFDPRTDCAALCIQHHPNQVLYDVVHGNLSVNDLKASTKGQTIPHVNFI